MKTLTEFSGSIVRMAAKGLAEAKAALPPAPPPAEGAPAEAAAAPDEATKAAFAAAVSKETGITDEQRLQRLVEAMEAVGDRAANVRLVRVYAGEEAVPAAKKVGEHQYVVDLMPESMKQVSARPEKPRGRGDRDRGPKRAEGSLSGSFSMDSIKEDRGGGRRGPGGPPAGRPKT